MKRSLNNEQQQQLVNLHFRPSFGFEFNLLAMQLLSLASLLRLLQRPKHPKSLPPVKFVAES